jgi:hypothetical protein
MEDIYPKYVTKAAIDGLVEKVKLPAPDEFDQDWEYIVSDSSRLDEFLYAYENTELTQEEKFALMIVIISSYEDALVECSAKEDSAEALRHYLIRDVNIHRRTIDYWALIDEDDPENYFIVTPFIRDVAGRIERL